MSLVSTTPCTMVAPQHVNVVLLQRKGAPKDVPMCVTMIASILFVGVAMEVQGEG